MDSTVSSRASHSSPSPSTVRPVVRVLEGLSVSEGAGVQLTRLIGTSKLPNLDPFLMLDEFRSDAAEDYLAGFPDHPHRGFQTVTYMLAGQMRHQDSHGHSGLLRSGGVQWMNAGRGIIHSEMPEQTEGLMWGFQLWVNLPATEKMSQPAYQEFDAPQIPVVQLAPGLSIKVIAGTTDAGVSGAVQNIVSQPLFLDVSLAASGEATANRFVQATPSGHTAFVYVYEGSVQVGDRLIRRGQLALLGQGERVEVLAGTEPGRFLLVAGAPIGEPIAQRGPFVMNSWVEVKQAFDDYLNGNFA